jgi:hypothetical protein
MVTEWLTSVSTWTVVRAQPAGDETVHGWWSHHMAIRRGRSEKGSFVRRHAHSHHGR